MHPQEFRNLTEHLYEMYYTAHEEVHRLKKENKVLNDELGKAKAINSALNAKLCTLNSFKILKMGAEWFIDGDPVMNLSLVKRLKFTSPICNVRMSSRGRVAFTSNRKIFLLENGETFLVENGVRSFDLRTMRHNLTDTQTRIFDFLDEDLIVYEGGCIRKYTSAKQSDSRDINKDGSKDSNRDVNSKDTKLSDTSRDSNKLNEINKSGDNNAWTVEWSVEVPAVVCIRIEHRILYIGASGASEYPGTQQAPSSLVHIYNEAGALQDSLSFNKPFTSFLVKNGHIISVYENYISIDSKTTRAENGLILSYDVDNTAIFYISDSTVIKAATSTGLEPLDSISFKRPILSLVKYKGCLLVATQDRVVNIFDLESKKAMRIVAQDNVIDMCCNTRQVCFVDNNGGLSVWEVAE